MSRRNPRIRSKSLEYRNTRSLQQVDREHGDGLMTLRSENIIGTACSVTINRIHVVGWKRRWYAFTFKVGRAKNELIATKYRATTPRAAYLKALWSKP